jgi:hypothetical protein
MLKIKRNKAKKMNKKHLKKKVIKNGVNQQKKIVGTRRNKKTYLKNQLRLKQGKSQKKN